MDRLDLVIIQGKKGRYLFYYVEALNLFPVSVWEEIDTTLEMELNSAQEAVDYLVSIYTDNEDAGEKMDRLIESKYPTIAIAEMWV